MTTQDPSGQDQAGQGDAPRQGRRLSDKLLVAFHQACDQADFEVAEQLLHVLERIVAHVPATRVAERRRSLETLVAAHERLLHLRHPHDRDR